MYKIKSLKIHEAKTEKAGKKKKNRQIYNCNLGCSILLAVNNKTTRQKRIKDIEELSINTIN